MLDVLKEAKGELVSAAVSAITNEVEPYRSDIDRDALQTAVARAVGVTLDLWRVQRSTTQGERVVLGVIGRGCAEQEVPAAAISTALATARTALWTFTSSLADDILGPASAGALAILARRLFDVAPMVESGILDGHRDQTRGYLALERARTRAHVFTKLVLSDFDSEQEMQREAGRFGIDLRVSHGLLYITAPIAAPDGLHRVSAADERLQELIPGASSVAFTDPVDHTVLIIPADEYTWTLDVRPIVDQQATRYGIIAVPVGPRVGAVAIAHSARQARAYIETCARVIPTPQRIDLEALAVLHMLSSVPAPDRRQFVQLTIGRLLGERDPSRRLAVLRAWGRSFGNTQDAAERLRVHANTIRYHMTILRDQYGFNSRRGGDARLLIAAMVLAVSPELGDGEL